MSKQDEELVIMVDKIDVVEFQAEDSCATVEAGDARTGPRHHKMRSKLLKPIEPLISFARKFGAFPLDFDDDIEGFRVVYTSS